jgi:uncharacterized protein YbjT (DUF2867 family)
MILVAGSTGVLGSEICRRLIARGEQVRALVRATSAADKVAALQAAGAQIVRGDLKDRASLDAACAGVDAVVSSVSMVLTAQPGDSFDVTDGAGNMALVDAARAARVRRFVFVSFDNGPMPDSPLGRAKAAVEAHLKTSGMEYTILQPGLFMESWLGPMLFCDTVAGTAKVYGNGDKPITYVAVGDVAEVAAQSVRSAAARNAVIPFGGPEGVSQRDAVRIFEAALGKPLDVTAIPEAALEEQWRSAPDPLNKAFAALMLGVSRGAGIVAGPPTDKFSLGTMKTVREFAASRVAGS